MPHCLCMVACVSHFHQLGVCHPGKVATVGTTYPCIVLFTSFLSQRSLTHLIIIGKGNIRIKYNLTDFLLPICSSSIISSILTIIYTTSVVDLAFMNHALFSSNRHKCSAYHATLLAITPHKHSTTHRLQTNTPEIIHIHTITFLEQRIHRSYFLRVILFIRSALKDLLHHFNHSAFHLLV